MITVYRIVKTPEPTRDDFLSDGARGKRPRDDTEEAVRRHGGFSVWTIEEHALAMAKRFPVLGGYIAYVKLPAGATLEPFPGTWDHQTAYGDPDAFLASVVRVVRVG